MPEQPLIIGVRHHSPACARLVKERIEQTRPRYVLIEGPVDFNQRLDELFLPHQLPIAIYSYCQCLDAVCRILPRVAGAAERPGDGRAYSLYRFTGLGAKRGCQRCL